MNNNYSKQREYILEIMKNNPIHPTADKILELVKKIDPKISKSTVYRNINILVEIGEIKRLKMLSGPDRYDYLHKEHIHCICEKCKKIIDIYDFDKELIIKNALGNQKKYFDVKNILIYGICKECKSNNNK